MRASRRGENDREVQTWIDIKDRQTETDRQTSRQTDHTRAERARVERGNFKHSPPK